MDLRWERSKGGRKPEYLLRDYAPQGVPPRGFLYTHRPIVGFIRLTNPKKMRWQVARVLSPRNWNDPSMETLCHLTRVDTEEAMAVARMMLMGGYGE
jgi:hypothetical protein